MTDKPPEEVLAEALERQGIPRYSGRADQFRAVLTALPGYIFVRRDELERLREALAQITASLAGNVAARGGFYDYEREIATARALLNKEDGDGK